MKTPTAARVLFVLTSHGQLGDTGRPTGFHLGETVVPWRVLRQDGHEVDFVSVQGGRPPMIGFDESDPGHRQFLADPDAGGRLQATRRPEEVAPADYQAVYFVGGHGAMWDFPGRPTLRKLTRDIFENGGVVAAICHGPAALVGLTLSSGEPLLAGRTVTGFSHEAEAARGLTDVVPFSLQHALEADGAAYSCAPDKQSHVVVSGRLVTGQNPASTPGTAAALARLLAR